MRALLLTLLIATMGLTHAHAQIGWTYEQCVAHWGHESDHIFLQKEDEDNENKLTIIPLFIFHYGNRYIFVEMSHHEVGDNRKSRVIKEEITDQSGF